MKIRFTKMHGCGNDYIYINCFGWEPKAPGALAVEMSKRHTSVGADGIVLIFPSTAADAKMRMFNCDGSEGLMCGNAIRCVGKYIFECGIAKRSRIKIETPSGIKELTLDIDPATRKVAAATVMMGRASFAAADIPVLCAGKEFVGGELCVSGQIWRVTCVSMGNPHAVIFVDDINSIDVSKIGRNIEYHEMFPERTNVEFVHIIDENTLEMRVWERGSGETYACGTGACAAVASAVRHGYCRSGLPVTVRLLGGELTVTVEDDGSVTMTGGAVKVYEGIYETEAYR